jgi:hypothetical protein
VTEPEAADFDGCVIGESLRDPTLVNHLRVWRAWISPDAILSDDQGTLAPWHIYWVTCTATEIDRIQKGLKPWRWYAHFWKVARMIVVYCDARFEIDRFDRSTWTPAVEHGRRKGIPEEQLDFLIIPHDDAAKRAAPR